jgi:hypothetical protein
LEIGFSQLANNFEEQHELISQGEACSFSGFLEGSQEELS